MASRGIRKARWALSASAALLAVALGLPPSARGAGGAFDISQHGFCSITTTQACGEPSLGDAECPAGETCVRVGNFINPCSPTANPPCDSAQAQVRMRVDLGAGAVFVSPFTVTVNRVRWDLDCVANSGFPCTDQGDIVEYLGDATITTNCSTAAGNVVWTTTTAQGGNEIVFTPTDGSGNPRPLVIDENTAPGDTSRGGCSLFFNLQVVSQEPASGPLSDFTPQVVEQVVGFINGEADAVTGLRQYGNSQTNDLVLCPTCTGDACECDVTLGVCVPPPPGTSCPAADRPPDCSGAVASPNELWPANHQFVAVSISGVTDPDGDAVTITVTGISQDEPLKGEGTGNTCPDAAGVGTSTASLRAERSGAGDGRAYHVSFRADDGKGGQCSGTVAACVPRSGHTCVDQGALADSTSCP